jgi:hypothetical protein
VIAEDERTTRADAKTVAHLDAAGLERAYLGQQVMRVQHDAIADEARDAFAHDARRHQVELVLGLADNQRVSRIVATLKAHHTLGVIGKPVDDLALAFVAPLGTDDHDIL